MRLLGAFLFVLAVSSGGPAIAQTPPDISDLVGARAPGGETQMQARGYTLVRTEDGDDRKWTYWWNPRTRTCVTVATLEGRYDAITTSPAPDCSQPAGRPSTLPAGPVRPVDVPSNRPTTLPSWPARPTEVPSQPTPEWFDLGLVCFGEGQRPQLGTRYGYTWDNDKGRYVYGNQTELSTQDFDASVNIQLWQGGGRIRLPDMLIPPIHSRGDHGWWELDSVNTTRDTITAQYRLNGMNKPRLTIDRRSGRISIRGMSNYAFSGTCDTIENQARRF